MKQLKFSLSLLVFALAFTLLSPAPAQAATYSYNPTAAVAYADKYSCNYGVNCGNLGYQRLSADCTNFTSQAIRNGGFATNGVWAPYNRPWAYVADFFYAFITRGWAKFGAIYSGSQVAAAYTAANRGDLFMYNWGKGEGWSHLSMEAGWGARASLYAGDGQGDFIDQHTTDRWHAPWNYGYLHPDSSIDRAHMQVDIIIMLKETF